MSRRKEVVRLENIVKIYPTPSDTLFALRGIDLTIEQGELIAIMGRSGSGKSTLMNILGCLDRPTEGRCFLNGEDVAIKTDEERSTLRAEKIGFIFQSFQLIPQLTVYENVGVPFLYQRGVDQKEKEKILYALERVGLQDRIHHIPSQLSGGEMQRVAIARAFVVHPLFILADEPTGNLDNKNAENIMDILQELHSEGVTIVLVTHDKTIAQGCQRIVAMEEGRLIREDVEEKEREVAACLSG